MTPKICHSGGNYLGACKKFNHKMAKNWLRKSIPLHSLTAMGRTPTRAIMAIAFWKEAQVTDLLL
jgi:hypothetical protein